MPISFHFDVHVDAQNEGADEFRFDVAFITTPNGQANVEVVSSALQIEPGGNTGALEPIDHRGSVQSTTHPTLDDPFFAMVIRAVEEDNSGDTLRSADRASFAQAVRDEVNLRLDAGGFPNEAQLRTAGIRTQLVDDFGDDDDLISAVAAVHPILGQEIYRTVQNRFELPAFRFRGEDASYAMSSFLSVSDDVERGGPFLWKTSAAGTDPEQNILIVPYIAENAPQGEYSTSFSSSTTQARLLKLVFGDATEPTPSLAGYFREISRGKVSLINRSGTGVIDPQRTDTIRINYPSGDQKSEKIRTDVLTAAAEIHDFNAYRPFDNGRSQPHELTNNDVIVVILAAAPRGGGNVRSTLPATIALDEASSLTGRLRPVAVPETTTLPLLAHEVLHAFGLADMYGPFSIGWNQASILGNASQALHLDPMHKIYFGWATPRVIDIAELTNTPRTEQLLAASVPIENSTDAVHAEPIIVWDSRVGSDEFFVLEYRNSSVGPAGHYDQGHPDWGVACWHVRTTNNTLAPIPTHIPNVDGDRVPDNDDRLLGTGWRQYDPMFAAEDNIIYGVQSNGQLMYYRHDGRSAGTPAFSVGGHRTVASDNDWDSYDSISYAGQGIFYCVNDQGLTWRKVPFGSSLNGDLDDKAETHLISAGSWLAFTKIVAGDEGVIYCVKTDGTMVKYKHQGWQTGTNSWGNRGAEQQVNHPQQWNELRHLGYGAEGSLLGVRDNGEVVQFRELLTGWGEEIIWQSPIGQPVVLIDWRLYLRFFPSRDGGIMYAQQEDGALIWHEYSNGSWTTATGSVIQGPMENYISWGHDGVLDTEPTGTEKQAFGNPINLYASPNGVIAAKTGFWRPEHNNIDLRWSSGDSLPLTFKVSSASQAAPKITVSFAR